MVPVFAIVPELHGAKRMNHLEECAASVAKGPVWYCVGEILQQMHLELDGGYTCLSVDKLLD